MSYKEDRRIKEKIRIRINKKENSTYTIFDIGANDADDAIQYLFLFNYFLNKVSIYCFEPDLKPYKKSLEKAHKLDDELKDYFGKDYLDKTKYNSVRNDEDGLFYLGESTMKLFNFGLANESNSLPFYSADNSLSGSIKKPIEHINIYPQVSFEKSEAKFSTLDEEVSKIKNNKKDDEDFIIDFIHMDVQGAELEVIDGGKETFENNVCYLYTEFSNVELYENCPTLEQILDKLGDSWELVSIMWECETEGNALLKNKKVSEKIRLSN